MAGIWIIKKCSQSIVNANFHIDFTLKLIGPVIYWVPPRCNRPRHMHFIYFILFSQVCKTVFKFTFHRWRDWGLEQYSSPVQKFHSPVYGPWYSHMSTTALGRNIDVLSSIPQINMTRDPYWSLKSRAPNFNEIGACSLILSFKNTFTIEVFWVTLSIPNTVLTCLQK